MTLLSVMSQTFWKNRAIFSELSNGCVTIAAFDALCLAFRCLPSYDRSVVLNSAKQHYLVKRKKTRWARLIHYELHLSGDHVFHLGAFVYFQYTTVPFFDVDEESDNSYMAL